MRISAFILAAGKGTRMFPITSDTPKPMLPILNKPIIFHSIERLLEAQISDIGIIIGKNDQIIPSYINSTFPDLNPCFIVQEKALGTAHAVLEVQDYLTDRDFLVIAGDSLFPSSFLKQLSKTHLKEKNDITLTLEKMEFELMKESSTVDFRNGRVFEIREKPQTPAEVLSELNSAALYMFSVSIFKVIKNITKSKRGEYELATAINKIINQGGQVGGLLSERVCHISTIRDLWRFNLKFLQETLKGEDTKNLIGNNVTIKESAAIKNSILGDNSLVKEGVELNNCVVLPHTTVEYNYKNALIKSDYTECFKDNEFPVI
ncbi:MAG: NTP transferase domain-containing protein [Candidatus Heimdallarchaeota archaeon]|nr:MAG: NTP transferase domain-containing protein [Candidatus Heimdallarchaeota archaeon]